MTQPHIAIEAQMTPFQQSIPAIAAVIAPQAFSSKWWDAPIAKGIEPEDIEDVIAARMMQNIINRQSLWERDQRTATPEGTAELKASRDIVRDRVVAMAAEGDTLLSIAIALGVSRGTVSILLGESGTSHPVKNQSGRPTDASTVAKVKFLLNIGIHAAEVARRTDVSPSTVARIKRRMKS